MNTTCTVDASSTTTPADALSITDQWDDTITSALNDHFILNAQDNTLQLRPPYHPFMPLPTNRPVSECRDYPEYAWNREFLRYHMALIEGKYDDCYEIAIELQVIARFISCTSRGDNQYINNYVDAAKLMKEDVLHRECDSERTTPNPKAILVEASEEKPILWKAR